MAQLEQLALLVLQVPMEQQVQQVPMEQLA